VEDSGLTVQDVIPRLEDDGATFLVYTDIVRDGMHAGPTWRPCARCCAPPTCRSWPRAGSRPSPTSRTSSPRRRRPGRRHHGRAIYEAPSTPGALAWRRAGGRGVAKNREGENPPFYRRKKRGFSPSRALPSLPPKNRSSFPGLSAGLALAAGVAIFRDVRDAIRTRRKAMKTIEVKGMSCQHSVMSGPRP
jgi:hypothetical protein